VTTSPTTTTTPIQQSAAAGNALSTRAYEALAVLVVIAALVAVFYALNRTKRKRR
jgi:branched-subunit amino acid ABC-type transport system permease component